MPRLPPAASAPVAKPSSYPAFRISGKAIRVIVAAVATDEPQTAPKQADATIAATDKPPRTPESRTRAARNKSAERRVPDATSPISTNKGITDKEYAEAVSNGVVPARARALCAPDSTRLPKNPTKASATHTGTRRNSITNRTNMPAAPINGGLIRVIPRAMATAMPGRPARPKRTAWRRQDRQARKSTARKLASRVPACGRHRHKPAATA